MHTEVHAIFDFQKSAETLKLAENLHSCLSAVPSLQSEVVLDDRLDMSIGYRIKQADIKGYPYAVILGKKVKCSAAHI